MGEAQAAAASGAEALFWNPAGLARLTGKDPREDPYSEFSASYGALLETSFHSSLAYARPVEDWGVFGAGWNLFSQGSIASFNEFGDATGSFNAQDMVLAFGYARWLRRLALGASLKGIRSSLAQESGHGAALDLGLIIPNMDEKGRLDLAFGLLNLGPEFRFGGTSDPLPFLVRAGGLLRLFSGALLELDLNLPVDRDPYLAVGAEYGLSLAGRGTDSTSSPRNAVAFRMGYNTRSSRGVEGLAGLSAGMGFRWERLGLDYAWAPFGDLGTTHRVSLTARF